MMSTAEETEDIYRYTPTETNFYKTPIEVEHDIDEIKIPVPWQKLVHKNYDAYSASVSQDPLEENNEIQKYAEKRHFFRCVRCCPERGYAIPK